MQNCKGKCIFLQFGICGNYFSRSDFVYMCKWFGAGVGGLGVRWNFASAHTTGVVSLWLSNIHINKKCIVQVTIL